MGIISRLQQEGRLLFLKNGLILFFVEWVRGAFLISFLPTFAADRWGLSLALIGTAVSVHYLTDSLVKSFVGMLLDRFPSRFVLHCGFALAFMGLGLLFFFHLPWVLLISSGLIGVGFSPIWLVCISQIQEDKRAEQMGVLYVFWLAGLGLGPLVINFFLDTSYRASFLLLACMFVAGWMLVGKGKGSPSKSAPLADVTIRKQLEQLWDKLRNSGALLPGMVLQTMGAGMLVPFLSNFAVDRVGLSHTQFSLVILIGGTFAVGSLVPMGKWFDRSRSKWFLAGGFGMFGIALFGLLFVHSFLSLAGIAILMGVSYAGLLPAWNSLLAQHIPQESQGTGWGIFSTIEGLGIVIGPLIGSWLAAGGNVAMPFAVSAALFGLISAYYCVFRMDKTGGYIRG